MPSGVPLPHVFKDADFDSNEEERRLFFVALTRARKKLFLAQDEFCLKMIMRLK